MGGLLLTMMLGAMNQTVIAPALPTMVGELGGADQIVWAVTAFILASTVTMPIYGRLGDLAGRRNVLVGAIAVFAAGSLVGALAGNMPVLILGRALQGLGAGGLLTSSQAVIADIVPARERGPYMALNSAVFALSSVGGPLLGGWLTDGPGWRWTFWINLPLAVLATTAALAFVRLPARPRTRLKPDYAGMALLALVTSGFVLTTSWLFSGVLWSGPRYLAVGAATVLAAGALVVVEHRAAQPVIPPAMFRSRTLSLACGASLLIGLSMFGALSYMPMWFQMVAGASPTASGLLIMPMMVSGTVGSLVGGQVMRRTGRYRLLLSTGGLLVTTGLFLLSLLETSSPAWRGGLAMGVLGLGMGASAQLVVVVVQNSFPRAVGAATGLTNYFRQIGASLGAAVVGAVFGARLVEQFDEHLVAGHWLMEYVGTITPDLVRMLSSTDHAAVTSAFNDALTPVYLAVTPLGVVAAILFALIPHTPLARTIVDASQAEPIKELAP